MNDLAFSDYHTEDFATDESFQHYCWGTDPQAAAFWEAYIVAHPEQAEAIAAARKILLSFKVVHKDSDPELKQAGLVVLNQAIAASQQKVSVSRPIYTRPWASWVAAASVLLFALLLWRPWETPYASVYETASGETRIVELPDGSKVNLNANSKLTLADNWTDAQTREVWIEGEAYFEVVKLVEGGRVPFVVNAGETRVVVKGTAFNVKHRERGEADVVLEEGIVSVLTDPEEVVVAEHHELTMKPGERVLVKSGQLERKESVRTDEYTSWKDGVLIFRDSPFTEVAERMKELYGKEVFVDERLMERKIGGVVRVQERSLFLKGLSEAFDIQVIEKEDSILIQP